RWATRAEARIALVGRQPRLRQVPPTLSASTRATVRPDAARWRPTPGPAWPAPMTTASNARVSDMARLLGGGGRRPHRRTTIVAPGRARCAHSAAEIPNPAAAAIRPLAVLPTRLRRA